MQSDLADTDDTMDMSAHERTYRNFVTFVKYSLGGAAILLTGMAVFLT